MVGEQELRAQRLARTQARMQEQLAEKQARDAREEAERASKGDLRLVIRPRRYALNAHTACQNKAGVLP